MPTWLFDILCGLAKRLRTELFQTLGAVVEPPAKLGRPVREGRVGLRRIQNLLGVEREIGIVQRRMPDGNQISLAIGHDGLGLVRIDNDPDDHSLDICAFAHFGGVGHLETIPDGIVERTGSARRFIDYIDTNSPAFPRKCDGIVNALAFAAAIDRRDADERRFVLGPDFAKIAYDFQGQTHGVGKAAAIFVAALVGERRQEGIQREPMGAVEFQHIEPGAQGLACSAGEIGAHLGQSIGITCGRPRPARFQWPPLAETVGQRTSPACMGVSRTGVLPFYGRSSEALGPA
jgi:hypothetical protein